MSSRQVWISCLAVGAILMGSTASAPAQQLPRTIKIINSLTPGGSSDIALRIIGQQIQEMGGPTVVIESKPGGAGSIALNAIKMSEPDGSTIGMCESSAMAANVWLFNKLSYDPAKDFKPITPIYDVTVELVVPADFPAGSLKETVEYAKKKPGGLNYASQSIGASGHLFGALMAKIAGVPMTHIPFKGAAPAMTELITNRVDLFWTSYPTAKPFHEDRKVKVLATSGAKRNPLLPDVPTVREAGFPQFEYAFWFGLCAPAGTPDPVAKALNELIVKAVRSPQVLERYRAFGFNPDTSTPAEFAARIVSDIQAFKPIVEATGAKID